MIFPNGDRVMRLSAVQVQTDEAKLSNLQGGKELISEVDRQKAEQVLSVVHMPCLLLPMLRFPSVTRTMPPRSFSAQIWNIGEGGGAYFSTFGNLAIGL